MRRPARWRRSSARPGARCSGGKVLLALANPKLLAGIAALAFYLWRKNMLQTIVFGMLVFTLLRVWHVFGAISLR
jgi:hypothetical protein